MLSHPQVSPLDRLIDAFGRLEKNERKILQFLSIVLELTSRTNLARYLPKAEIRKTNGKAFTAIELKPVVEKLRKRKLVEMHGSSLFRCAYEIVDHVTRSAVEDGTFKDMAAAIQGQIPVFTASYYASSDRLDNFYRSVREVRIGVYGHDVEQVERYLPLCREQFPDEVADEPPMVFICATPFDPQWFRTLPLPIQTLALEEMVPYILSDLGDVSEILALLETYRDLDDNNAPHLRKLLVSILIFQGNLPEAETLLDSGKEISEALSLEGWLHFLRGENAEAIRCFEAGLSALRKATGKRKAFFSDLRGFFYLLALLKTKDISQHKRIEDIVNTVERQPALRMAIPAYHAIRAVLLAQSNRLDDAMIELDSISCDPTSLDPMLRELGLHLQGPPYSRITELFSMMARFWIDVDNARGNQHGLQDVWEAARKNGYRWVAMEVVNLLANLGGKVPAEYGKYAEYVSTVQAETGIRSILSVVAREERWERALRALVHVGTDAGKPGAKKASASRLVWMVSVNGGDVNIRPREQVCSAKGTWSKGRAVALKRLSEGRGKLDFLTDQDRRICATISREYDYDGYYGSTVYEFDTERAMLAMVGHPLVFREDSPGVSVEVVKAEPELLVGKKKGRIDVQFSGGMDKEGIFITQETPTRIAVVEVTPAHEQIIEVLGRKGLQVPLDAKQQVLEAVQALSSLVTVHSGIGGGVENIHEFSADRRPHIHLLPMGDGLKVNLLVRPFSDDGPYFQPGKGGQTIIAEVKGKRMQTSRDLREEKTLAEQAIDECPALIGMDDGTGSGEWLIDEQDKCLELLLELQALGEQAVVEWPEGEKLKVRQPVSIDSMRVKIRRDNDWFAVTGELTLDESLVLDMAQLLDLTRDRESRFIPIGEGQFVALTETFRRRLAEIEAFSEKSAKGRRFHGLAGLLFQDLANEAGSLDADKHWKKHIGHIHEAQQLDPVVPSTLQAELRDYQIDGFRWLARLAAWGVGACLADDMGLGKTLQALALILDRAAQGPSLVVAPTSVCLNWQGEVQRFAPTLDGIYFGPGNRQEMLDGLGPFDLLICSYGLLQQEADKITAVQWNVIVLDEAQAIKNRLTKRSKAAMALSGTFRMITTGTPIENHLGELWNLFRFLNPGLLGSLEKFNERFAIPVERYGEKEIGKRLKKLIQPFLLRRTKTQVLEELPPRTEIVLHVEMSPEEAAFYEVLRQQAVQQIEELDGPIEQKNFQILAELMRLRRACCNSRLVMPESAIQSTKLALFRKVVEELLENHHKALVFSQFVDHLGIIRESLDKVGITYQYLDGSTPPKERKRRVDAFQAGEGDLFLISLKAGGVGINLTAADYVIHMDPWWNPAVEDQASDRAHRIGQQRPVTIYRLVTKDTIEEKIVDLHRHKRDLADGLLEGGEMSGKMSAQELLKLIREQG